ERGESSAEEEGAGERRQARSVAIGGAASERREDDRAAREGGERDPAPHARAGERHGKREQRPVHREVLKSDGRARRREGANPKERRRERRIRMTRLVPQERDRGWQHGDAYRHSHWIHRAAERDQDPRGREQDQAETNRADEIEPRGLACATLRKYAPREREPGRA